MLDTNYISKNKIKFSLFLMSYIGTLLNKERQSIGWLVGCFGFNSPLRQYFSLYRAVSQREGEGEEKG